MCVIAIVEDDLKRPTPPMVKAMFDQNDAGGGVAWREDGKVHWDKGLGLDAMQDYIHRLPVPFIAHFRIPTCGPRGSKDSIYGPLCHPFPIQKDAPLALKGSTSGGVLFHNGHWSKWEDTVLQVAINNRGKIPGGEWSDSRAMAFLAAHVGIQGLQFVKEKIAVLTPDSLEVFGSGWKWYKDLLWVSNDHWDSRMRYDWRDSNGQWRPNSYYTSEPASYGNGSRELPVIDTKALPPSPLAPEVSLDTLPFAQIEEFYRKGQIGKKRFKRLKRLYESRANKTFIDLAREQLDREEMVEALIIKH